MRDRGPADGRVLMISLLPDIRAKSVKKNLEVEESGFALENL